MADHAIDLAIKDGDASWCSCTCGWASPKTADADAAAAWVAHVAEQSLTSTSRYIDL